MVNDYYKIEVPEDITDPEERARIAIAEARERARLYTIPATWVILEDDGRTVKVKRTRNKTSK